MDDKIELNWTLNVSYTFKKYDIFQSLEDLFNIYEEAPDNVDYPSYVIEWLNTNLKDSIEEFLDILDPMIDIDGEIDNDNIVELLDNKEFMEEFRDFLND